MWIIDNNPTMITTFASFWQTLPGIYYQRFLKFHLDWKNVHFFPNSSITIIISRERLVVLPYIFNNMPAKFLILMITSWNIFNFVFKFLSFVRNTFLFHMSVFQQYYVNFLLNNSPKMNNVLFLKSTSTEYIQTSMFTIFPKSEIVKMLCKYRKPSTKTPSIEMPSLI